MVTVLQPFSAYAVMASSNILFVDAGVNENNTNSIFLVEQTISSYVPGRAINGITGFSAGKGYYIQTAQLPLDLTGFITDSEVVQLNYFAVKAVIVDTLTPMNGSGGSDGFNDYLARGINVFQAKENGTYTNGQVVSGIDFKTTDLYFYYINGGWAQQIKENKINENDFTVLSGNTWDWAVSNKVTKSLSANTVLSLVNTHSGNSAWLECQGNGFALNIAGIDIPATASTTSIAFMKVNNKVRIFIDNNDISIVFVERILSAAGGLSSGSVGYGGAANQQWFGLTNHSSVTSAGIATKIRFNTNVIPAGTATALVIRVWRKNGSLWDVIGSQSVPFSSMIAGDNTVTISTPFSVQIGDRISGHYVGNVTNTPFTITSAGSTAYDVAAPAPAVGYDMDAMGNILGNYMAIQLIEAL